MDDEAEGVGEKEEKPTKSMTILQMGNTEGVLREQITYYIDGKRYGPNQCVLVEKEKICLVNKCKGVTYTQYGKVGKYQQYKYEKEENGCIFCLDDAVDCVEELVLKSFSYDNVNAGKTTMNYSTNEDPLAEIQHLRMLTGCEYIVQLLDVIDVPSIRGFYCVFPAYDGTIQEKIGRESPEQLEMLQNKKLIFAKLIEGLNYMHEKGIVHCDFSVENICMKSATHPVIIDLGASQRLEQKKNADGKLFFNPYLKRKLQGKWYQMPLEILNFPKHPSETNVLVNYVASDTYSLGIVLLVICLHGVQPWESPLKMRGEPGLRVPIMPPDFDENFKYAIVNGQRVGRYNSQLQWVEFDHEFNSLFHLLTDVSCCCCFL